MTSTSPQQTLKAVFGFDDFRGGQQAVVSQRVGGALYGGDFRYRCGEVTLLSVAGASSCHT